MESISVHTYINVRDIHVYIIIYILLHGSSLYKHETRLYVRTVHVQHVLLLKFMT